MKTKKITLFSHAEKKGYYKPVKVTIKVPEEIWFASATYDARLKLSEAKSMTTSQFLLSNNGYLIESIKIMKPAQVKTFKKLLGLLMSKRSEEVAKLVDLFSGAKK